VTARSIGGPTDDRPAADLGGPSVPPVRDRAIGREFVWGTTDDLAAAAADALSDVERRFICSGCRVKWFVAIDRAEGDPRTCSACGGALVMLPVAGEPRPVYGKGETHRCTNGPGSRA
jgi:hypothetical protein